MSIKIMQGLSIGLIAGLVIGGLFWSYLKPVFRNPQSGIVNTPPPRHHIDADKIAERIQQHAMRALLWIECFYDSDGSVLAEMPDGGTPGTPEDTLRQYLEYAYLRLKAIADNHDSRQALWKNSLGQLIGVSGQTRLGDLARSIEKNRAYFQQTCPDVAKIQTPSAQTLTKEHRHRIKLYAWVAFTKVQAAITELAQLQRMMDDQPVK